MKKYIHTALKGTLTALLLMVGVSTWADNEVAQIGEQKYATLQAAIDAASNEGATTIQLINGFDAGTETYSISKYIILDFNGKTITASHNSDQSNLFEITSSGKLTVTGNGTINDVNVKGIFYNEGTLTIETGTFTTTSSEGYAVIFNTGSTANCTVNNGSFNGAYAAVYNANQATMTIKNGSFTASNRVLVTQTNATLNIEGGTISNNSNVILARTGAKLNVTGGTITAPNTSNYQAIEVTDENTEAKISGGNVTGYNGVTVWKKASFVVNESATISGTNTAISGNGTEGDGGTTITINGGTITNSQDVAIYHPQDGTLTIAGGTITGTTALEVRSGTVSITGGTFTATAAEYSCNPNGGGTTTVGAALAIAQHTTKKDISVTISGGKFTGVKAISESNPQNNDPAPQVAMSVTDGDFHGGITVTDVPQGGFIKGGTYSEAFPATYCVDGKAPYVDENGACTIITPETEVPTDAEALSNGSYYKVLGNAITAAGNTATTISVLKDPVAEAITIPASADITFSIADGVEQKKPITNSGALTISSGTTSGAITIAKFEATVKIATGVTSTSTIALNSELQTENVLKSSTTKESGYTSYWVEKKVKATVALTGTPTSEQTTAANALVANTSIKEVTGLATNQSLTITVTSVELTTGKVTKATFEVKLINTDGVEVTGTVPEVKFRLPISDGFEGKWVNLWHNETAIPGMNVFGASNGYVNVTTTSFSPFKYEIIENPIAQIGETKYASVADAITAAPGESPAEATEITLLQSVSEDISVGDGKNVKLTIGSLTVSGDITNAGTLTIADGTIEGAVSNTGAAGTLTISGTANITGAVSASAGTLAISGGTIDNTITTTGTAGLNITGGIMDHAISIGGSGENTISGGTISGTVNTSAATTISGGEITSGITNSAALTISGGTFTGTITNTGTVAISGGTHTVLPVPEFCATGYMPIRTAADVPYTMTYHWTIVDDTNLSINNHLNGGTYSVKTATYKRNTGMVSAGNAETKYGTICLPFNIIAEPEGMTLYKATEITSTTLTISPVTYDSPVVAGTPLIFELSAAASNMTVTSTDHTNGIAVNTTAPATSPVTTPEESKNLLVGTYTETKITDTETLNKLYYLNGDAFHQAVTSLTVPAYRAYIHYVAPSPAKAPSFLNIMKDGNENQTTGISAVEAFEGVTTVYDLNGRKQSGLQRGVNIMRRADGSTIKVIVK